MCTSICASEIETQIYHRTRNMLLQKGIYIVRQE